MPRIQQYVSPEASRGLDTSELSTAAHRIGIAGRETADSYQQGLSQFGQGIEQLGEHIGQSQKADYLSAFTQHQLDEDAAFEKAKQDYGTDPNFTQRYLEERKDRLDKFNEQFDGSMWGTGAQEYQRQVSDQAMLTSGKEAVAFQTSVDQDKSVAAAETATRSIALNWSKDPLNGNHYLEQLDTQVKPTLPPEHQATEMERLKTGAANLAGESLVTTLETKPNVTAQDVDTVLGAMQDKDGALAQHMSIEKMAELEGRLGKLKFTLAGTQQAIAEQQLPDIVKQLKTSGSTDAYRQGLSLIAGHMPAGTSPEARREAEVWKAKQQRDLDDAAAEGRVTSVLMDKSDNDLNAIKQQAQAAQASAKSDAERRAASATLNAIGNVHTMRDAEFSRDPAVYAINHSPTVNAAAQAFAQQPSPQTWADYAAKATAYQRQIKGQGYVPQLATKEIKDEISGAMQSITTDANGTANAGQTLAKWQGITGGNWPNLARELQKAGVLNQDQFVAASLYGSPKAQALAQVLLSSSRMSTDQRFALHGVGEYHARGLAAKSFDPLNKSYANLGPEGAEVAGAYVNAASHLLQLRGENQQGQSDALAQQMVLGEYDFQDGGTLRVPKNAGVDTGKVGHGADRMKGELGPYEVDVPKSESGLNPGDQRSNYIGRLGQTAHWYTTPDGKGATLYPAPGASTPVTVKGKPLTLSWKQLEAMGG